MDKKLTALIIRLMHLRDINDLRKAFKECVYQINNSGKFKFYLTCEVRNLDYLTHETQSLNEYYEIDAEGSASLTPSFFDPTNDELYAVVPIQINVNTMEYLAFDKQSFDEESLQYIGILMLIYKNQADQFFMSEVDQLTNLRNRKAFNRMSNSICLKPAVVSECYVVVIKIDGFHQVIEQYGLLLSDELLVLFGHFLKETFRLSDLIFRYSGTTFTLLFKNIDNEIMSSILDRCKGNAELIEFPHIGRQTMSAGYSKIDQKNGIFYSLDKADQALRESVNNGGNLITNYTEIEEDDVTYEAIKEVIYF